MANEPTKPKYVPFRRKLIFAFLSLIGAISVLVVPLEANRPFDHLDQLISNARMLVAGVRADMSREELARMNRFVMGVMPVTTEVDDETYQYQNFAFQMLVTEGRLATEQEVQEKILDEGLEIEGFDYARLEEQGRFWEQAFAEEPGVLELFHGYKRLLIKAKRLAEEVPFSLADIYIMLDSGRKEGIFEKNILFVLDGYQWWEIASYAGEPYTIEDNEFWRRSALEGRSEFGNNPRVDPDSWFLPRFDEDEWGVWFSVWKTEEVDGMYNILTIDFDATSVKKSIVRVAGIVTSVGVLVIIAILFAATMLARMITRPVIELRRGSEEVAKGNYDYLVPLLKEDELGELTVQFNAMVRGQKERLNLKATLEKMLSKELAEQAGQQGLVLGGKKTNCSLMFTDFAGFSTISQYMTPNDAVSQLNLYFETLIPIIKQHGGFPDKYIGDAIVAIFGAPIHFEDHADKALRCAVEMQRALRKLNQRRREKGLPVFEMRIGINSGEVIVGAIGCDMKLEYTSIGETTNLANRMENACNIGHVMMTEATHAAIDMDAFEDAEIDREPIPVYVKGYAEPVSAYRLKIDDLVIEKSIGDSLASIYRYGSLSVEHQLAELRPSPKG